MKQVTQGDRRSCSNGGSMCAALPARGADFHVDFLACVGEQREAETTLHADFCWWQMCKLSLGVKEDAGSELHLKRGVDSLWPHSKLG